MFHIEDNLAVNFERFLQIKSDEEFENRKFVGLFRVNVRNTKDSILSSVKEIGRTQDENMFEQGEETDDFA
jgi:hypothetical protein